VGKKVRCPTCRRFAGLEGNPYRPFCSERCKLVDLGNWASDRYRIPGPAAPVPDQTQDDKDDEAES
jgi:endogenous inhibitor of DNA gyrase (YacG/DUF329 family)